MKTQTLAYSPCPNDTFLFYHFVHSPKNQIREILLDVEELNTRAFQSEFDITKLSFSAFFQVLENYALLRSGGALGSGVGPILVKRKGVQKKPDGNKIAIPGIHTTANLLTHIYLKGEFQPIAFRYDLIIPELLKGNLDFGVIIHEERFTYESFGLEKVMDLGEFWESTTKTLIPLGAIAVKRSLGAEFARQTNEKIVKSLEYSYKNREEVYPYIQSYSQNKDTKIIDAHINLYVNEYTKDIGELGEVGIYKLYEHALKFGFLKKEIESQKLDLFAF